jgi:hypothetical protein
MNKLLATLIASLFAVSTAFAASHAGAPMATEKKDAKAEPKTTTTTTTKKSSTKKEEPKEAKKEEKKS